MEKKTEKINIWRILIYFIIYSFIGFVVETLFALVNYNVLESRKSFLYGPFCGIYGVGAVVLILVLRLFNKNNYTLFLGGCITGSIIEYIMSFLGEILFGARWWDYSKRLLNINGRICLLYSIFWGVLSLILIRIINPTIDKFIDYIKSKINLRILKILTSIAMILMIFNVIASGIAMELFLIRMSVENNLNIKNKPKTIEQYNKIYGNKKRSELIQKFWGDEKMIKTYPNLTIQLEDGNVVYIKDLLPNVKTHIYKFDEN